MIWNVNLRLWVAILTSSLIWFKHLKTLKKMCGKRQPTLLCRPAFGPDTSRVKGLTFRLIFRSGSIHFSGPNRTSIVLSVRHIYPVHRRFLVKTLLNTKEQGGTPCGGFLICPLGLCCTQTITQAVLLQTGARTDPVDLFQNDALKVAAAQSSTSLSQTIALAETIKWSRKNPKNLPRVVREIRFD